MLIRVILITFFINSCFADSKTGFIGLDLRPNKGKTEISRRQGHFTVAYFLSSGCPCSQAHFDHLNQLQKDFGKKFQFIGFHSSRSIKIKKARQYFAQFDIDFPIINDPELVYANQFKALKTPHIFVVSPSGEVVFQGGATDSRNPKRAKNFYLKTALEQISRGHQVTLARAKTLGCYIQR